MLCLQRWAEPSMRWGLGCAPSRVTRQRQQAVNALQCNLPTAPWVCWEDWLRWVVQGWLVVECPQGAKHLKSQGEAHWATHVPPVLLQGGQEECEGASTGDSWSQTWERTWGHLAHAAVRDNTRHAPPFPTTTLPSVCPASKSRLTWSLPFITSTLFHSQLWPWDETYVNTEFLQIYSIPIWIHSSCCHRSVAVTIQSASAQSTSTSSMSHSVKNTLLYIQVFILLQWIISIFIM